MKTIFSLTRAKLMTNVNLLQDQAQSPAGSPVMFLVCTPSLSVLTIIERAAHVYLIPRTSTDKRMKGKKELHLVSHYICEQRNPARIATGSGFYYPATQVP